MPEGYLLSKPFQATSDFSKTLAWPRHIVDPFFARRGGLMLNLERATKDLSESAEDEHGELPTLDRTLVATLARRQFLVEQAAASGRSIEELVDPVRLARLLTRVQAWAMEDGLSPVLAQRVYVAILQDTIPRQLRLDTTRRQQTDRVALDCSPPVSTGPSHD